MIICFKFETIRRRYYVFLKLLVGWYLFDSIMMLPYYDQVYGKKSIYRLGHDTENWFFQLTSTLRDVHFSGDAYFFIVMQFLLGCLILLKNDVSKFYHLLFFITSMNLQFPLMYGLDGGNNLAQILYLYFIFFDWSYLKKTPLIFKKRTLVISYSLSMFQIFIVYFTAATSKIKGDDWLNGDALFIVLQNPQYYSATLSPYLLMFPNLLKIGTYFTIFFQLLFPLILLRKLNFLWIFLGVMIHFMIAIVMGLLPFGIFMVINYVFFVDDIMFKKIEFYYDEIKLVFKRKVITG